MKFKPEDFEDAFGITHHDYKTKQHNLTWREICERASEAANDKIERKFKHGDRVAVYLPQGRRTGKVELAPYMPHIVVELTHKDEDGTKYTKIHRVHPKTCRRLK